MLIGYALVSTETNAVLKTYRSLPDRIDVPDEKLVAYAAAVGWQAGVYALVEMELVGADPKAGQVLKTEIGTFDGTRVIVQRTYGPPTTADLNAIIMAKIFALEAKQDGQFIRDAIITPEGKQALTDLNTQIADLRAQLQ